MCIKTSKHVFLCILHNWCIITLTDESSLHTLVPLLISYLPLLTMKRLIYEANILIPSQSVNICLLMYLSYPHHQHPPAVFYQILSLLSRMTYSILITLVLLPLFIRLVLFVYINYILWQLGNLSDYEDFWFFFFFFICNNLKSIIRKKRIKKVSLYTIV